ncbi:hypothetical protein [Variovorax paradoxus]|uniref:hypothetical protein n=1 Tax=Variovorax paradoxus TaxID=34073 RepID=UPI003397BF4A
MFRVQGQFELANSVLNAMAPGIQHFHLVEQVFEVPLWIIKVRQPASFGEEQPRWTRFLATRAADACGIATSMQWERSRVHVLLPGYMTTHGMPVLARCAALWECSAADDVGRITWLFETDLGPFVDPQDEVPLNKAEKSTLRWKDLDSCSAEGHATI